MTLRSDKVHYDVGLFGDVDIHLFHEGTHYRLHDRLGAHPASRLGKRGYIFSVWAPHARGVSVIGEFNGWCHDSHPLKRLGDSGVWEGFIHGVEPGMRYKYRVVPASSQPPSDKADPMAFAAETPPATASVTWDSAYAWQDNSWMRERNQRNRLDAPITIYELHPGSWKRADGDRFLNYRELAPRLAEYLTENGFTHVELLPVMEHPFYGSWGYQVTGYFAPTSRYGNPDDLKYLIDTLHRNGIGVILDWVPSHFPDDAHGLFRFDGTALYEHPDPRRGLHPEWHSCIFDYGRPEVRSFLISNAVYWLDEFHADGLRVDGVASMLYLDYSRAPGQWQPNHRGGRENLEAIEFIRNLNTEIYRRFPDVMSIAEESTSWPLVSRPVHNGGLGFGLKWDMGWMHDTLSYFSVTPAERPDCHGKLTFRGLYAFAENYILPLSHDEVVHGKAALLSKMPGDDRQKFANLRLLYTYMWTLPGKKLLFMGGEIGQWSEWRHDGTLDWSLLRYTRHRQLAAMVGQLNALYRRLGALHRFDHEPEGFTWISADDAANSVLAYRRSGCLPEEQAVIVLNFAPTPQPEYYVPMPEAGAWRVVFSSDSAQFGGTGRPENGNLVHSRPVAGGNEVVVLDLAPLTGVVLVPE